MKKEDIIEYLKENCICDPNTFGVDEMYRSICLVKCKAEWHWRFEVQRQKVLLSLPMKYNPPDLVGAMRI